MRGVNTSRGREVAQLKAAQQPVGVNERHLHVKTKSSTCGAATAVEVTVTRSWPRLWRMTGGSDGVGGGVGNNVGRTVATMG